MFGVSRVSFLTDKALTKGRPPAPCHPMISSHERKKTLKSVDLLFRELVQMSNRQLPQGSASVKAGGIKKLGKITIKAVLRGVLPPAGCWNGWVIVCHVTPELLLPCFSVNPQKTASGFL